MANEQLSLGTTALLANRKDGIPVVRLNYVCAEPRLPLPYPDGDWYLANTAIPAARDGEIIIANTLLSGLREYYQSLGLVLDTTDIREVDPMVNGDNEIMFGFPATDALERLRNEGVIFRDHGSDMYAATTFSSHAIREQTASLDLKDLGRPDSFISNNKAYLRDAAALFGYSMLPGRVLTSESHMEDVLEEFAASPYGVWLKFPTGSGGDLVYRIPQLTEETLYSGVASLRDAVRQAFEKSNFAASMDAVWHDGELFPLALGGIVVESDARNHGQVLENGSTQYVTNKDAKPKFIGHFRQMTTDEGEYLGNRPFSGVDERTDGLIRRGIMKVASYNILANRYYGIQGVDWFLVRDESARDNVFFTELNSRPTANTPPVIIAEKLHAPEWINTNCYANRPISSIQDYIDIVGEDLAFGSAETGLIVPQSFRSHVANGTVVASEKFKAMILGQTADHCDAIVYQLAERGVRFTP